MKVNGKDVLETYGLKQWNVEMAYGEIGNESSWEAGCPVPVLLESNFGLKKIKVSVLAKGETGMRSGERRESSWQRWQSPRCLSWTVSATTLRLYSRMHSRWRAA